jgi:hypothetical protein
MPDSQQKRSVSPTYARHGWRQLHHKDWVSPVLHSACPNFEMPFEFRSTSNEDQWPVCSRSVGLRTEHYRGYEARLSKVIDTKLFNVSNAETSHRDLQSENNAIFTMFRGGVCFEAGEFLWNL